MSLDALIRAVLDKLLDGDDPVRVALRDQISRAKFAAPQLTGVGFFQDFAHPPGAEPVAGGGSGELGDVYAAMAGLECVSGFLLFVRGGYATMLEGHTYGERWPDEIAGVVLDYDHLPRPPVVLRLPSEGGQ